MHRLWIVGAALLGVAMMTREADAQTTVCRSVLASGGCTVRAPETTLTGTFGQPIAGIVRGALRNASHGFWIPMQHDASDRSSGVAVVTGETSSLLLQAHPNPSTQGTDLAVRVPSGCVMSLHLVDVAGRYVRTLIAGERADGEIRHVRLDAAGLPSGTYTVVLDAGAESRSISILLVR